MGELKIALQLTLQSAPGMHWTIGPLYVHVDAADCSAGREQNNNPNYFDNYSAICDAYRYNAQNTAYMEAAESEGLGACTTLRISLRLGPTGSAAQPLSTKRLPLQSQQSNTSGTKAFIFCSFGN